MAPLYQVSLVYLECGEVFPTCRSAHASHLAPLYIASQITADRTSPIRSRDSMLSPNFLIPTVRASTWRNSLDR